MIYVKETLEPYSHILLMVKKFNRMKFKIPKKIVNLLVKKFPFKRTLLAFNPESWSLQDSKGSGRWHLERRQKNYYLHYDKFDPDRGFEYLVAHFIYDLSSHQKRLIIYSFLICGFLLGGIFKEKKFR